MWRKMSLMMEVMLLVILNGCGGNGGSDIEKIDVVSKIRDKSGGISWDELSRIVSKVEQENPGVSQEQLSDLLAQELINVPSSSERGIPYQGLNVTWQEVWLLITHYENFSFTRASFYDAMSKTRERFVGFRLSMDQGDAFRHAYWNILLCKRVNETWARLYTTAHESETPAGMDKTMDLHNNAVGRYIYRQNSNRSESELERLVYNYRYVKVKEGSSFDLSYLIYLEDGHSVSDDIGGNEGVGEDNPPPDTGNSNDQGGEPPSEPGVPPPLPGEVNSGDQTATEPPTDPQPPPSPEPVDPLDHERVFYWAIDRADGHPRYYYQAATGQRVGWLELDGEVRSINVVRHGDRQVIIADDQFGNVWVRTQDQGGFTNWQVQNATSLYPPMLVSHNGLVYQLIIGTDHVLYTKSSPDGLSWQWAYDKHGGEFEASVTGVSFHDDIYLFAVGVNHSVWWCRFDGVKTSNWERIDGELKFAISPTVVASHIQLLGAGLGGELWHRYFDGQSFTRWLRRDGAASTDPATVFFANTYFLGIVGTDSAAYFQVNDDRWEEHGGSYYDVALSTGLVE